MNPPEQNSVQIPPDFPYREVLRKGRPKHAPMDPFSIRHPSMPLSRRAKIFSPFDALKGFGEAIGSVADASRSEDDPF